MKKTVIISISLNVVFFITTIIIFYNSNIIKKDLNICKKKTKWSINTPIIIDKTNPIYIYQSRKFPCDSGYTSYDSNICMGERLHFVDSLLNMVVKSNLKEFDFYIKRDNDAVLHVKDNYYFINSLRINIASKQNFIKSQKLWEQMRMLNSEAIRLGCDGGTGCSGIVSKAEIKYVLERIEKIRDIKGNN